MRGAECFPLSVLIRRNRVTAEGGEEETASTRWLPDVTGLSLLGDAVGGGGSQWCCEKPQDLLIADLTVSPQADVSSGAGDQQCSAETNACAADATCLTCLLITSPADGSCDDDAFSCADLMDNACCIYGASCSSNALFVAHFGKGMRF